MATILDNMTQNHYPTPLTNSIAMATPKIPGDQKLFESVCYMLILKATKFQLPIATPNSF